MDSIRQGVKKLLRTGFFHIFGSSVINKIIAFMSTIVLVRILTKTEYGAFTYVWNIYSIILIFNGLGIESGVLQLTSENTGKTEYVDRISNYGTRFGLKFNFFLVVLLMGIGLFAPLKIESGRRLLCTLSLLPLFQILYGLIITYLRSQKRNKQYAYLQTINTILIFVVSASCALIFREIGLAIGYYVAYIVSSLIGIIIFHVNIIKINVDDIGSEKKPLLRISFISMLNNGLSQLMYLLDVFLLGFLDPQETILASYKVATMIPTALTFIPLSLITYLYPYFAERNNNGKWCLNHYKKILLGLGSFNFLLSTFLFIAAPLIIRILFGGQYLDAVPIFRVLSINYFFSGTFRILSGNLLVTQRKLKFNLFVAVVSSLINLLADFFFIQWWGSMGAALATILVVLLSSVLSTTYLLYTFKKKAKAS